MPEPAASSKRIESFALSLADIRTVAVEALHALSLSVRWPHRAEDWTMLLGQGEGLAALDDIGRVMASAMWFPQGAGFATIGMVITSPRLQTHGAGHWLMQHAFGRLGPRDLGLNATRAAERLYLSLGFKPEAVVHQHQGEATAPPADAPAPDGELRALGPHSLPLVAALDGAAFGHDRSSLLADLLSRSEALGLFRNEALVALSLCRAFGRGRMIGPVVASCDEDAAAVVEPHLATHAGSFLRLDTRRSSGPLVDCLTRAGLPLFDTVTTMSLGRPWLGAGAPAVYGLTTQATG